MATKSIDISKLSKIAVTRDSRYQVLSTTGVHCSVAPTGKILIDFYIDLPPLIVDSEEGGDLQIAANPERRILMGYEVNPELAREIIGNLLSAVENFPEK